MKTFLPLFLCLSLFYACKQEKSTSVPELEPSEKKISAVDAKDPTILKTSTGKSIELITDQKSSSLNDLKIVALDFTNTKDTFKIEDCDPLQHAWIQDLDGNGMMSST